MLEITNQIKKERFFAYKHWLVVSIPLKNMKVSWDQYSQYMEK